MTTVIPAVPDSSAPAKPERATATLLVAFSADPVVRWLWPDSSRYLTAYPRALQLLEIDRRGTVDLASGDVGAALWHAPGIETDTDAVGTLIESTVSPERHDEVFALLEQMSRHHPDRPHWYLPFIGVDPTAQGRGHGSQLLAEGLARADREGVPAYLEASTPRNRTLYERHGFQAFAEVQVASSPPLWPMLRPAR